ncbi:MAG: peptidylprolyl isomerase [Nitrososphaeria archaeon]|nr:peptidylprolyl isomerase [Nitrososphaeria archaeon]NDB51127.1 peptidylprolyl isomerase [Nitrosopumilaceae archaeon]NDB87837.1 peptidylprolyl isomerase [Nitrososphaerota archaeon]NDB46258.1 peptidylprolyl isomerase [Nitrososphaeria archaeon]NDB62955.1 peptidylprolyl isomerase [Nitrosopumilaceae archaeon]
MAFTKGSLILIDYTAKVKDSNEVVETTIIEDAKKHNLFQENIKYQPKLVSVGESWVLKGLDDALANAKAGDKLTVDVTPDKGFGERDSGKVRMIPLRKLGEDADKVGVGDTIEVDQKEGVVRFVGSGRVQVDFNHRLAGKTIVYDVNVLKALETNEDKINGVLKRHMPVEDSKISSKLTGNSLDVTIPEELFGAETLRVIKHFVQMDIFKFVPTLEKINFVETYNNKKAEKKEEAKPAPAKK